MKTGIDQNSGGTVTGSGTANTIPLWTAGSVLGDSYLTQNGTSLMLANNKLLSNTTGASVLDFSNATQISIYNGSSTFLLRSADINLTTPAVVVASSSMQFTLANPILDLTHASTLFLNSTTNRPITTGTGLVTIGNNLAITGTISSMGTPLAATIGGTAQTTYATGDTLYASAANTLSKLTGNITTQRKVLSQTGSGAASAAPSWNLPSCVAYGKETAYSATTTATNEVTCSIPIPAGTIAVGDLIELYSLLTNNNNANAKAIGVWLSTANETVGAAVSGSATQIALISGITTTISNALQRHFCVRTSTSIIGFLSAISFGGDTGTSAAATSAITIPSIASDLWLVGTVNRANGGDTATMEMLWFTLFKK